MHDGPLQSLIALWRELDSISPRVSQADRAPLLDARATTEAVADELRQFSRDMRPSVLDDLGIAAALRAEAERARAQADLDVRVDVTGTPYRLDAEIETALLRIAQEALRNVEWHARARLVTIDVDFDGAGVHMRVADDGSGLDPIPTAAELLAGSHLGLIGMQERARMVGGSVVFRTAVIGGLEVDVEVPAALRAGAESGLGG